MLKISRVNGYRVVTYNMPGVETVSIGAWVNVGSRHEEENISGISHFIEHMVFKGTKTRTALNIANTIENVGGYLNAYTNREVTSFYAKVTKKHIKIAFDIISDMLLNPTFDEQELERERGVVLQEIAQTYDNPSDIIFDYYQQCAFKSQQFGSPVLGNYNTVKAISRNDMINYMKKYYEDPDRIVFSAAGNIEHTDFESLVEKSFKKIDKLPDTRNNEKGIYTGGEFQEDRGLEQAHLIIGFEGVKYTSDNYYDLMVYSNILGGGMSSKLFQEIREKKGLVYAIYSFPHFFKDAGTMAIYAGTWHNSCDELTRVVLHEMNNFTISDEELSRAKNQLISSTLMDLENTSSMSDNIACDTIQSGTPTSTDETVSKIESVTKNNVMEIAEKLIKSKITKVLIK